MNVLVLSEHCCIRVIKQALALTTRDDVQAFYLQNRVANKECIPLLPRCAFYNNQEQLEIQLRRMEDIDVIHVHNEPDWLVEVARKMKPDTPIIYDVHDLASQRDIPIDLLIEQEKRSFPMADAYIFPSRGYETKARRYHNVPDSKSSQVLYSYCNLEMMLMPALPRIRGIAYEGNLVGDGAHPTMFYRDHRYLAEYLTQHNIPITFYGTEKGIAQQYREIGAICIPILPYANLISNLSRHDWCFVGSVEPTKTLEDSMPNKLFESIIAGVPVIVCNSPEAGAFVEEHGFGVQVNSVHEIPEIYEQHEDLRKNVLEKRHLFTMESQLDALVNMYRAVTHAD